MAKQVIIEFDSQVTEEQQAFFDRVVEMSVDLGIEVYGFGGGIKNPKPKIQS